MSDSESLRGFTVALGVSGSISAYKAADLCSKLVQSGATVLPILTRGALRFVQPAIFTGLTGQPTATDAFDEPFGASVIAHLHYAAIADLFVVAPASADLLARLAAGLCDDMLTTALAANLHKPVLIAPAMNADMWAHPAAQANRQTLEARGYRFIEPGFGRLAEGIVGAGRLAEPSDILQTVIATLRTNRDLSGLSVLVTAGPTREAIDPVRFITNRSSGKMGYAVAEAAVRRGAKVTLVSGPVALAAPFGVDVVRVESAREMEDAVLSRAANQAVLVQAAAVADFRPEQAAPRKIKKSEGLSAIALIPNRDFSLVLGEQKTAQQTLVGFAAETHDLADNARTKLFAKNLDLIVANDVTQAGAGFDVDTNIVTFLTPDGGTVSLPQLPKRAVADAIWDKVIALRTATGA